MRTIGQKEIKEIRDFLLRADFKFSAEAIKFVIDAAMKEWKKTAGDL